VLLGLFIKHLDLKTMKIWGISSEPIDKLF